MKTILIATDFSNASRNASLYGVRLAKLIKANIILFTAYKIPRPAAGFNVGISRFDVMMQAEKKLQDEQDFLDPKHNIIEITCDEGAPETAILDIANEKKVDFIITGMKGRAKNIKKVFGSTATALSKNTNIPLIIVPENTKFKIPDTIVFANDNNIDIKSSAIEQLEAFSELFQSKLYVVTVVKNKEEAWFELLNSSQKFGKVINVLNSSFRYPVDTDIRHALDSFIKENKADMLIMMPHKHEWIERLFTKSATKDMLFHTHVPLLVLPEVAAKFKVSNKKNLQDSIHG